MIKIPSFLPDFFCQSYNWKNLSLLFFASLIIRAIVFGFFIQPEQRYWQADSTDYHTCAYSLAHGNGITGSKGAPIFWRTPGYPLFLSLVYTLLGSTINFINNDFTHTAAIWIQIIMSSIIPLLLFFLVLSLTGTLLLAWISGWMAVFHTGFVLASCYLLSDSLSLLFFLPFLLFFYKSFSLWGEPKLAHNRSEIINIIIAAIFLALYTWIRPNGQFVFFVVALLLFFSNDTIKQKCIKVGLFFLIFFSLISGWYIRNYQLTGHWFYCSMSGPVLQAFTLPKVLRRLTNQPLKECHAHYMRQVAKEVAQEQEYLTMNFPGLYVSKELICARLAWPEVFNHPFYCAYEWVQEVIKTTFDLYSSQTVSIVQKKHKWDPMEEFLSEKIWLCLIGQQMPLPLRIIIWIEFLCSLFLWIGIIAGIIFFIIQPLLTKFTIPADIQNNFYVWIKLGFMIVSLLAMTGGFGYARLRLPIDPLFIVLSLQFWYWYGMTKKITSLKNQYAIA